MSLNCSSLKYFGGFGGAAAQNAMAYLTLFDGCTLLEYVGDLPCTKTPNNNDFFLRTSWVRHVEFMDFKNRNQTTNNTNNNIFKTGVGKLRYIVIKNIGYLSTAKYEYLHTLTAWGNNSSEEPNARQSLVDTLTVYTFDRAGANETARQTFIVDALGTAIGIYASDALPESAEDGDIALVTGSAEVMAWNQSTTSWVVLRTAETGDKYATATSAYTWSGSAWTQWTEPYPTFSIRIASATYNLLTAEEKATIVARGYTITAV